jgi:hypothetical protein
VSIGILADRLLVATAVELGAVLATKTTVLPTYPGLRIRCRT